MQENLFAEAKPILRQLTEHGHEAYFVGGCVRDMLLERPIGDIDIATSATPEDVIDLFPKVIPVGMEHGTVIVRLRGISYEVTTFRVDGQYSDRRRPDEVAFVQSIDEDLKRRDFTMNAIAMDIDGKLYDPLDGQWYITHKQIETVGEASERFAEDALRMIRALRFVSQLGFVIEPKTKRAICNEQERIETLAVERITVELQKLFAGRYVDDACYVVRQIGIAQRLPVLKDHPEMIELLPESLEPLHELAETFALFHLLKPQVSLETWVKGWKLSNQTKRVATQLVNTWQHYQQYGLDEWLIFHLDRHLFPGFVRLVKNLPNGFSINLEAMYAIYSKLPIVTSKDLAIDGHDLMNVFPNRPKGKWIKQALRQLEYEVVVNKLTNEKNTLKEWIKWNPPEIT